MIKEIRDQLITDIQENIGSLSKVDKYRGEFEEGSDWNPTDTACFIQVIGYKPKVRSSANTLLKSTVLIRIYSGANFRHNKDGLDVTEAVISLVDGGLLDVDGSLYRMAISEDGFDFIYYERGFEGYAFNLMITKS